ncbi:hypothetical protein SERLA73DRAFT_141442 [Serpula lacrymans var. lacrymans S7.3]|uniref:Uncharacterized protein n=2 Tax=Serpula lacrymans var. lacrymans TaxID=341189 RepID=F8Q6E6_SERL3|nr:uncharacterized protein SERLADRAFT_397001 [Serpula lacrymans var. lacrymans S7.9]EGN96184.1 hypothetical protein SERLA73DRAFT_141442 [Serpula lacrymans var. lacrymans S7.3]EGO21726.1 hypothetical protein SERLADRAFT_397001 [Serpula lacrymans var. lacrymans S7.9]
MMRRRLSAPRQIELARHGYMQLQPRDRSEVTVVVRGHEMQSKVRFVAQPKLKSLMSIQHQPPLARLPVN